MPSPDEEDLKLVGSVSVNAEDISLIGVKQFRSVGSLVVFLKQINLF